MSRTNSQECLVDFITGRHLMPTDLQALLDQLRGHDIPPGWEETFDGVDPDTLLLVLWSNRLSRLIDAQNAATLRPFGLSYSEYATLTMLRLVGAAPVSVLQDRLVITSGGMTKTIDRLASRGLVERGPDPDDGRRVLVAPTEEGAALHREILAADFGNQERRLEKLSVEQRADIARALRLLLDAIEPNDAGVER